jgi:hypothetical protein
MVFLIVSHDIGTPSQGNYGMPSCPWWSLNCGHDIATPSGMVLMPLLPRYFDPLKGYVGTILAGIDYDLWP